MKKILAIAALVAGLGYSSIAQEAPKKDRIKPRSGEKKEKVYKTPEEFAKIRTERLDKELKFTNAQREQVYKLNLEQAKNRNDQHAKRAEEYKLQREEGKIYREKFEGILTPEQQKMFKEKYAKVDHKGENGRSFDRQKMDRKRPISKERQVQRSEQKS